HGAEAFAETARRPHRAPLVPVEERKGEDEGDEAEEDALDRLEDAGKPRLAGDDAERIGHDSISSRIAVGAGHRGEPDLDLVRRTVRDAGWRVKSGDTIQVSVDCRPGVIPSAETAHAPMELAACRTGSQPVRGCEAAALRAAGRVEN